MSGQPVGVVGDEQLATAVESADGVAITTEVTSRDDIAFALVGGHESLVEFLRSDPDVPVLIVDGEGGLPSISRSSAEEALERAIEGRTRIEDHPIVTVSGASDSIDAVFDVALMAAEPARISEFSVAGSEGRVSRFRADGVVASTPAGSHGYNRRAGGPVVERNTGVASVVPIAPFSTSAGHWVLPVESVELAVERDETPVELLVDGRRERRVEPEETIELSVTGALETYAFDELDA